MTEMPDRFDLYLFTGMPGTGKTTAAQKVADHLGVPVLDPDFMRRELGMTEYRREDTHTVMSEIYWRHEEALLAGQPVVMNSLFLQERTRGAVYRKTIALCHHIGKKLNAVLINCQCPEDVAKARIASRPPKDHLHMPSNDPAVWDKFSGVEEQIGKGEIDELDDFSFLSYESDKGEIVRIAVRSEVEEALSNLESILLK